MKSPIGKLDQEITLQRPVETPDGIGGTVRSWAVVESVWAQVRQNRPGNEAMTEGRMNASTSARFTIRTRADVVETWRIVWGGVPYNIRDIPPGSPRRQYMDLIAERGVME